MDNNFIHNFKKLQKKKKKPEGTSFFKNQEQLKELSDEDEDTSVKNFSEDEGLETESEVENERTEDEIESIAYSSDQSESEDNTIVKRIQRNPEPKKINYKILQEESDFDSE